MKRIVCFEANWAYLVSEIFVVSRRHKNVVWEFLAIRCTAELAQLQIFIALHPASYSGENMRLKQDLLVLNIVL